MREQRLYKFIVFLLLLLIAGGVYFGYVMISGNNPLSGLLANDAVGTPSNPSQTDAGEIVALSSEERGKRAEELIQTMTLQEKVAALFILPFDTLTGEQNATKATDVTKRGLEAYTVSGVFFDSGNLQSQKQITQMLEDTRKYSKLPLLMFYEENGGAQSTLAQVMGETPAESPAALAEQADTSRTYETGKKIGTYMKAVGFDVNLSPIANIAGGDATYIYSASPQTTFDMSTSMLNGLKEAGMLTCAGRFPYLTEEDPGGLQGIVSANVSLNELREKFFLPFNGCISANTDMIMMSSIQLPRALSANTPATLSNVLITDILRGELGFKGVVVSSPLNQTNIMKGYTPDNAAVTAILAGVDLLYMPEDFETAYQGLMTALSTGVLTEERINESLMRILKLSDYSAKSAHALNRVQRMGIAV